MACRQLDAHSGLVQRRVLGSQHEAGVARREQRPDVALSRRRSRPRAPCCPIAAHRRAPGEADHAARLGDAAGCGCRRAPRHRGEIRAPSRRRARGSPCARGGCPAVPRLRLPIRLERITANGLAIGLSTRIGSALPASSWFLDEAEADGLLVAEVGQRVAHCTEATIGFGADMCRHGRERRRVGQRPVAVTMRATSSIGSSSILRSREAPRRWRHG